MKIKGFSLYLINLGKHFENVLINNALKWECKLRQSGIQLNEITNRFKTDHSNFSNFNLEEYWEKDMPLHELQNDDFNNLTTSYEVNIKT